jgi:hypothetical protein
MEVQNEKLVHELDIKRLAKRDARWGLLWEHFCKSCSKPATPIRDVDEKEFQKVKFSPPDKVRDTLRELKLKMLGNWRRRTNPSNDWSPSFGKFFRADNVNGSILMVTSLLRIILNNDDITHRGNFYYPAGSFREWHTNQFDPSGWRVYFVHTEPSDCGMFRYCDPRSGEAISRVDFDGCVRIFRVDRGDKKLWHSVCSDGDRWSLGFHVSDEVAAALLALEDP